MYLHIKKVNAMTECYLAVFELSVTIPILCITQFTISFILFLMARTNKRGIAANKAQKAKQASRLKG